MAKTNSIDPNVPAGKEDPKLGDNRIRNLAAGIAEEQNVDHYMGSDGGAGTGYNEDAAGEHKKVTLRERTSKPTAEANKGYIYAKAVGDKTELFFEGEDGIEIQITSGGILKSCNLTGDQTIAGKKTFSGAVTLSAVSNIKLGSVLSASTAPNADAQIPNKKYVDDQNLDTCADGISRSVNTAYKATTSGTLIVNLTITWIYNQDTYAEIRSDANANPTSVKAFCGGKCKRGDSANNILYMTASVRIQKDDYYKVVPTASGVSINSIYFYPDR